MRKFTSAFLSVILLAGAAAAEPLAPGKPAGVQQAQSTRETLFVTGAALGLIVGFSFLISGGNSDSGANAIAGGSNQLPTVGGAVSTTNSTGPSNMAAASTT